MSMKSIEIANKILEIMDEDSIFKKYRGREH